MKAPQEDRLLDNQKQTGKDRELRQIETDINRQLLVGESSTQTKTITGDFDRERDWNYQQRRTVRGVQGQAHTGRGIQRGRRRRQAACPQGV
jgi:hypothetical protein